MANYLNIRLTFTPEELKGDADDIRGYVRTRFRQMADRTIEYIENQRTQAPEPKEIGKKPKKDYVM